MWVICSERVAFTKSFLFVFNNLVLGHIAALTRRHSESAYVHQVNFYSFYIGLGENGLGEGDGLGGRRVEGGR